MTAITKTTPFILNRVEVKYPFPSIVYRVQSGEKTYSVTLHTDGTAGCYDSENEECKGHHYSYHTGHECKHVTLAQERENEREYSAWKQANGLDKPMSREEYVREYDPDGAGMMLTGMASVADRLIARLKAAEQLTEVA